MLALMKQAGLLTVFLFLLTADGKSQEARTQKPLQHQLGASTSLIHYDGGGNGPTIKGYNLHYFRTVAKGFYAKPSATLSMGASEWFSGTEFNGYHETSAYYMLNAGYTMGYNGKYVGFKFINAIGPLYIPNRPLEAVSMHKVKFNSGYFLEHFELSMGAPIPILGLSFISWNYGNYGFIWYDIGLNYKF